MFQNAEVMATIDPQS